MGAPERFATVKLTTPAPNLSGEIWTLSELTLALTSSCAAGRGSLGLLEEPQPATARAARLVTTARAVTRPLREALRRPLVTIDATLTEGHGRSASSGPRRLRVRREARRPRRRRLRRRSPRGPLARPPA